MGVESAFRAAGVATAAAHHEAPLASAAMLERGITNQQRAEMFLAQVLHESAGLHFFEEIASGEAYEGRRDLGNIHPGDGKRYKGRGPIQLTGRANYRWAGAQLRLPLEAQPELAAQHAIGWRIAALYWQSHGLNALADRGDFLSITKRINGGINGLASRQMYLSRIRHVDCRPRKPDPYKGLTAHERGTVKRYDALLRAKKARHDTAAHRAERVRLRAAMTGSRKAIHHAAGPRAQGGDGHGWDYHQRRRRYEILRSRTVEAP